MLFLSLFIKEGSLESPGAYYSVYKCIQEYFSMILEDKPNYPISKNKDFDDVTLSEILINIGRLNQYLLSKWKVFLLVAILGASMGYVYYKAKKPRFTAVTTFVLEDSDKSGGGLLSQYSGLASMAGLDISGGGGIFQGENIIELYKSRLMIQRTLLSKVEFNGTKALLIDRYLDINNLRKNFIKDSKLRNLRFNLKDGETFNRLQDSVLGSVAQDISKKYLTIDKKDKKLSIIEVDVTSKSEEFSKDFNDQLVKTVNEFYVQTKTKKSLENLAILQHQTDSVRSVLTGAIYQAVNVNDATPNLNPTRQILRAPAQKYQFNAEANKVILSQLVQNLELAKITLRKETPLIQVIDTPVYPLQIDKVGLVSAMALGGIIAIIIVLAWLISKLIFKKILSENV